MTQESKQTTGKEMEHMYALIMGRGRSHQLDKRGEAYGAYLINEFNPLSNNLFR